MSLLFGTRWFTVRGRRRGGEGCTVKLPNCEQAVVAREKIVGYLLALDHPKGGSKAAYFLRFGFTVAAWQVFAAAVKRHACAADAVQVATTQHGTRYRVEGGRSSA